VIAMDGTILVMDYSASERKKVTTLLENIGSFNFIEIPNTARYHLIADSLKNISLVIFDIEFPSESIGFDMLSAIRKNAFLSDVPIIIITKSDKLNNRTRALDYEVCDYILKPFEYKRLEASIRCLLKLESKSSYKTEEFEKIAMPFESYVSRELKLAGRIKQPLSIILFTSKNSASVPKNNIYPNGGTPDVKAFSIVTEKARSSLRSTDTIAQNVNGDIIVILPCTDSTGSGKVNEKLRKNIDSGLSDINLTCEELFNYADVTYPDEGIDFKILIENALKKISHKEELKMIASVPPETREYIRRKYNQFNGWSIFK